MSRRHDPVSIGMFLALLIICAVVRFIGLGDFSLSNDELSAVFRLDYDSFSELIQEGVVKTDPHPAGGQVFLFYWTKIFGNSAWVLRFPFVISGLLAMVFLFQVFKDWVGEQSALLAITMFSLLEFTTIHSQLARPYAMGLLTCSAFVWSWNKILFFEGSRKWARIIFVIAGVLSCYLHYFSGLVAVTVSFVGLFPALKNGRLKEFLFLNLVIVALFLPHMSISWNQVIGSSGTKWIPPVDSDFFLDHIFRILNESYYLVALIILFILVFAVGIVFRKQKSLRFLSYSLLFYFIPFLTGYLFSIFYSPVLMDRVLIFSTPFLFVSIVGFVPDIPRRIFPLVFLAVLSIMIFSLIKESTFFERTYTENFKGIAEFSQSEKVQDQSALIIGNYNSSHYLNYYRPDDPLNFDVFEFNSDRDISAYMDLIKYTKKNSVFISYACRYQYPEILEFGRLFFPIVVEERSFYNSGYQLLKRGSTKRDIVLHKSFEKGELSGGDSLNPVLIDVKKEFDFVNLFSINRLDYPDLEILNTRITFTSPNVEGVVLVFELKNDNGISQYWMGRKLEDFRIGDRAEYIQDMFVSLSLPETKSKAKDLNIYLWNPNGREVKIFSAQITSFSN